MKKSELKALISEIIQDLNKDKTKNELKELIKNIIKEESYIWAVGPDTPQHPKGIVLAKFTGTSERNGQMVSKLSIKTNQGIFEYEVDESTFKMNNVGQEFRKL